MDRVLITGLGMLGYPLAKVLEEDGYTVAGLTRRFYGYLRDEMFRVFYGDISDSEVVFSVIKTFSPDIVIHTAAITQVDLCEKNPELAYRANVLGTYNVARVCAKFDCTLLYFSTDYVFDGSKKGKYTEKDLEHPLNVYGRTKLVGERIIRRYLPHSHYILRISTPYHFPTPRQNFLIWLLNKLAGGHTISVVTDIRTTPTCGYELFDVIKRLLESNMPAGTYHVGGSEAMSRYEFARLVARVFGFGDSLLIPVSWRSLDWIAARPRNSALDSTRIQRMLGVRFMPVDVCLREYKRRWAHAVRTGGNTS